LGIYANFSRYSFNQRIVPRVFAKSRWGIGGDSIPERVQAAIHMSDAINLRLLAIDHDRQNLDLIREALDQLGIEIQVADDPEAGFDAFLQIHPRIVLLGLAMPKIDGLSLMERMIAADPGTEIILMTAEYSCECAVEAVQKGACDYLTKPLCKDDLRSRVSSLIAEAERRRRTQRLDQELLQEYQFQGMISRSPLMLEVFAKIRHMAPHFRTVLVIGDTGTGKELVAGALHGLSPAAHGPFVVCNCSALVETLVESELFGYVRGSFTGANQDKAGLFENAHGGTIFLDEIGELSLTTQAKLLRVLQTHQVQKLGSPIAKNIDLRVVAATHRNLKEMVQSQQFREDLYYRIAMASITLPSLADRREDLPLLEKYFIKKFSIEYQKPIHGLTRRAQAAMALYSWPGNVRELENAIGNACMMAETSLIDIAELPDNIRNPVITPKAADEPLLPLEELQRRHILRVLEAVGGNKVKAAEILGVGRGTIYQALAKMKALGKGAGN